ncbi:HNH endonuclease [Sphingomonas piscis]|uniref:HNH endonuclease n=1 Tax=Sphingomonas piscis TaxID=2714943 RepID=A0A6G7YQL3_9SPHN|nr:HNH endonuclease [Sphingomonas piscis]QIK79035.1 HNH endonuclease [Sphingomonas piscis]
MTGTTEERCWLCARPLGGRVQYHHPVPKSRGGRETVPVHPICHSILHKTLDNKALARIGMDVDALRAHPDIARFLGWIASKPPDFHAPTRRPK